MRPTMQTMVDKPLSLKHFVTDITYSWELLVDFQPLTVHLSPSAFNSRTKGQMWKKYSLRCNVTVKLWSRNVNGEGHLTQSRNIIRTARHVHIAFLTSLTCVYFPLTFKNSNFTLRIWQKHRFRVDVYHIFHIFSIDIYRICTSLCIFLQFKSFLSWTTCTTATTLQRASNV